MQAIIETDVTKLHNITMNDAIAEITRLSGTPGLDLVVTPNIDHLARLLVAGKNSTLSQIYLSASLSLCDSRIIEKLLKFKNKHLKEVIPGSDLTKQLFESNVLNEKIILIVGGDSLLISRLGALYPHLNIQHINPSMGFINKPLEVESILSQAEALEPDFVFLAVGSPRQEMVASYLQKRLSKGVALCVGASLLFITGQEQRAPKWIQFLHFEWLYRMLQNPKVLVKRYFGNFLSLYQIYRAL